MRRSLRPRRRTIIFVAAVVVPLVVLPAHWDSGRRDRRRGEGGARYAGQDERAHALERTRIWGMGNNGSKLTGKDSLSQNMGSRVHDEKLFFFDTPPFPASASPATTSTAFSRATFTGGPTNRYKARDS